MSAAAAPSTTPPVMPAPHPSRSPLIRAIAAATLTIVCATGLCGCGVGYVTRAAYEEVRILWRRQPIDEVLARKDLQPKIRGRLETVLAVRKFARDQLGENVGGAYSTLSVIDKGAIVWIVMAARRDSLKPYTWWFPVVGNVPYRGYFEKADAEAEAASMEARGYDAMVRPAVAFSSLGFFNDPLLSNLLHLNRVELAGVIIHELFHRTYFLAGDVAFDESAATFVGSTGAVKFFEATEGPHSADAEAARGVLASALKFSTFLKLETEPLRKLYHSGLPEAEILKRRKVIFAKIRADYERLKPQLSGLERFGLDKGPINNAVLINYLIYFHQTHDFLKLYQIYHGNLGATIKAIIALARSDPANPFYAIWLATRIGPVRAAAPPGQILTSTPSATPDP